tara:strand:+ start:1433 stop:1714 length:282 start_codon:yes stop_codon:yes gene_type:complete
LYSTVAEIEDHFKSDVGRRSLNLREISGGSLGRHLDDSVSCLSKELFEMSRRYIPAVREVGWSSWPGKRRAREVAQGEGIGVGLSNGRARYLG